jgi:hypothetical protein
MAPAPGGLVEIILRASMGALAYGTVALLLDLGRVRGRLQAMLARRAAGAP